MRAQQTVGVPLSRRYAIVESTPAYREDERGDWVFTHTVIAFKDTVTNDLYLINYPRMLGHRVPLATYASPKSRIQLDRLYPSLPQSVPVYGKARRCTSAAGIFIKKSDLTVGYDSANQNLLHEARICTELSKAPHPNIAHFLGAVTSNSGKKMVGLAFVRYHMTLREAIRQRIPLDLLHVLRGIYAGLIHLHSLGFAHNDLNPYNIMLDSEGSAVIIDFDSCREVNTIIGPGMKLNTPGWGDIRDISEEKNDWEAFELIGEAIETSQLENVQPGNVPLHLAGQEAGSLTSDSSQQ